MGWFALALLIGGAASTSCTPHFVFESLKKEISHLQSKRSLTPLPQGYHDFRGVIHVHSSLSHDSQGTYEEILQGAQAARLSYIMMTEHDTPRIFPEGLQGMHEGILVIRGMEIRKDCRGRLCPSLLAIGLTHYFDHRPFTLAQTLDEITRQGGIVLMAHPNGWPHWGFNELIGMEIYDVLDDSVDKKWHFPKLLADILYSHKKYPDEVFLSIQDYPKRHLALWDRLQKDKKIVGIAGNDAHQNIKVFGRQVDPYAVNFKFVTTHLFAEALTESALLTALKKGHAYVAFDGLADATGFSFAAISSKGNSALMGESIDLADGQTLTIQSPIEGHLRLMKDGQQVAHCTCAFLAYPVAESGIFRVEIFLTLQNRLRPWIFSNPIYIRS